MRRRLPLVTLPPVAYSDKPRYLRALLWLAVAVVVIGLTLLTWILSNVSSSSLGRLLAPPLVYLAFHLGSVWGYSRCGRRPSRRSDPQMEEDLRQDLPRDWASRPRCACGLRDLDHCDPGQVGLRDQLVPLTTRGHSRTLARAMLRLDATGSRLPGHARPRRRLEVVPARWPGDSGMMRL